MLLASHPNDLNCVHRPFAFERGGVFSVLVDEGFFRDRLTVMNDTAAWDVSGDRDPSKCIDLDPFSVYENSEMVDDLLATVA